MKFAAGPPSQWQVTLRSGAVLTILADAYHEEDGEARFVIFMTASLEDFAELPVAGEVRGRTGVALPVIVARVPMSQAVDVQTL
ncbi:hypothetical protein BJY16_005751 [Actinoplanes octamycinicus]|uniref:Uncharacterized protein n=1 Tax=Actinoplanes octamycinicus TaxID=135948 RepID=A0A7W7M9U8_9ACTN|nr:hypothetical protein [Actinoplanes octamycinicus]MBB4742292.1 hypothetical protein [Actinoplanes octamycinicus]GIE59863.1 hypothetical protein Aoc01nite_52650 [Actinoplanes octamycinicus]